MEYDKLPFTIKITIDAHENYRILEKIGSGRFGRVFKAKRIDSSGVQNNEEGREYAIKVQNIKEQISPANPFYAEVQRVLREISTFGLSHPNIVKIQETYFTMQNELCIVMELAQKDLYQYKKDMGQLRCKDICDIMLQVCQALDFVHDKGIVGKSAYMAPEIVEGKDSDKNCDTWSLGILIYYLCTGYAEIELQKGGIRKPISQIKTQNKDRSIPLDQEYKAFENILNRMLSYEAKDRPEIQDILAALHDIQDQEYLMKNNNFKLVIHQLEDLLYNHLQAYNSFNKQLLKIERFMSKDMMNLINQQRTMQRNLTESIENQIIQVRQQQLTDEELEDLQEKQQFFQKVTQLQDPQIELEVYMRGRNLEEEKEEPYN
ncbi:mitogen-activated protein kinase kinase 2 [Stylonychia lemnae]|uniref:non-specific serine/threonine protein kinase n=1 Tax=Stylonychia lemnae TaxID=5949 RepID=A0A078AWQ8_STYLE|nr:mitogen-activated protein kinase kinase 2 [Stylonychia lemnae]|eukprot:CDW86870.1 mitogen-activated protein kinase kinase 2 [Stylonychia lemnae]